MQNDFAKIIVMEAIAYRSDEEHLMTICPFINGFGDVVAPDQIVGRIERVNKGTVQCALQPSSGHA